MITEAAKRAADAIGILGSYLSFTEEHGEHVAVNAVSDLDDIAKIIQQAIDESRAWIPVTERMPRKWTERCLMVVTLPDMKPMVLNGVWSGESWMSGFDNFRNVTHWMPLPEFQSKAADEPVAPK